MNRRYLLFTFVGVPALLPAADPWKKKADEWSSKDATRILTNSPWAKTVSAGMGDGPGGGESMGGPPGGGMGGPGGRGMGGPGGGSMGGPPGGAMGGPGGGGMGGPGGGGMEAPKFVVRWESAVPVREAAAKLEDADGAKIAGLSQEFYVISVISMPAGTMPGVRRGEPGREGQRPQPDYSRMQDQMIQITSLRIKGHDAISPAHVRMLPTGRGLTALFLFPRSLELPSDAKEAEFETSMGRMVIKAKFSFRDMTYEGRPAL